MDRRHFIESSAATAAAAATATLTTAATGVVLSGEGLLRRRIPSSGEMLPVIGLGTSGPFEVGIDPRDRELLAAVLSGFFKGGATVIDTSPMYSSAESVLGDLLDAEMHSRAFIATKVWTRGAREGVMQMTRSMELLRRKKVELMQVHNLLDFEAHLPTLRRWKEEGRIRYIGITHYTVESQARLAEIIEREPIDFVQFNYSATTTAAEVRLLPLCADKGVAVLANRAFDDGKIFSRLKDQPLPAWAADIACTSWAQLLLKFVIGHPAVTCVIPATGKLRNLQDNLVAGRRPLPDAQQRKAIAAAVA